MISKTSALILPSNIVCIVILGLRFLTLGNKTKENNKKKIFRTTMLSQKLKIQGFLGGSAG